MTEKRSNLIIGIDPGVKTGIAVKNPSQDGLLKVDTMKIHQAFRYVEKLGSRYNVFVYFEDARQRKWFGDKSILKRQGAGAIKIQCKQWEDFLTELKQTGVIRGFKMLAPKDSITKIDKDFFYKITNYKGRTSEHGRDAAMLILTKGDTLWDELQAKGDL